MLYDKASQYTVSGRKNQISHNTLFDHRHQIKSIVNNFKNNYPGKERQNMIL